jgi:two-component system, OmpR family, phosphate regulon sensor histidine kinase PhoR
VRFKNIEIRSLRNVAEDDPGAEMYGSLIASLGALGTGMIVWDGEAAKVEWANKAAAELLNGVHDETASVKTLLPSWAHLNPEIVIVAPGDGATYDRTVRMEDGSARTFEVAAKGWKDGRTIVAFRDVSDRRRLEEFRDRFVASAAHELKTPLTPVAGLIKTLKRGWRDLTDVERDDALNVLERQSQRLLNLVQHLLDLSRLEAGKFDLEMTTVLIPDVIEHVVSAMDPDEAARIQLDVLDDLEVHANAMAVEQILTNLLTNAARYGGESIRVITRRDVGRASISVTDDGPGIPASLVPRLFEPFARAGGTRSGSGLGLSIARLFAEACGGTLNYHPGTTGATFTLVLPTAR